MFHHEADNDTSPRKDDDGTGDSVPGSPSIAASPYWGQSTAPEAPKGFSPIVGFCFTINYILGTGFLTVPWAFAQGGLVLSTVVIITVGIFSDMAKNYLLESMARAEAMLDSRMHWIKRNPGDEEKGRLMLSPSIVRLKGSSDQLLLESQTPIKDYESTGTTTSVRSLPGTPATSQPSSPTRVGGTRRLLHKGPAKYLVKQRKFEVNSLCRVFVGKTGLRLYTGFICLYIYCTLWAYTCVFASAMAKAAPMFADGDADSNYLIFALIFSAVVVPMSCMELEEQVLVQVLMTLARFVMLAFMVGTSDLCAQDLQREADYPIEEAPMIRFQGISKMAPIMVFAHIYHHSIPGLSHPVNDKKQLSGMFRSTIVFSTLAYAFIGLVLSSSFGVHIEQSSNLNWKSFTGGTAVYDAQGQLVSIAWWAQFISVYVLCFPALDVLSAFPLNAITLGNNMMGSFYGKRIHEVEHNRWIRTQFRLLASIPPIAFGIMERQLGKITDYAGTTGFVIGFTFPALLYIRSRNLAKKKHYSVQTFYSGYSSSNFLAWGLFIFGIIMVLYVVFCLIVGDEQEGSERRRLLFARFE